MQPNDSKSGGASAVFTARPQWTNAAGPAGQTTWPTYLLLAIHCHQPVGNFGFVLEEAFRRSYEPFITVLERHETIRVALHYSGSLLDWLLREQRGFIDRLARLSARGQVEFLASGYYEPILPLIPEADRQGQIALMRQTLRRLFGVEATGLWLAERVWEPELPRTLAEAGIHYTILDTNQFATARTTLPGDCQIQDDLGWDLRGCYVTEYVGSSVAVFPASKRLRYWLPFQEVSRSVEFLRHLSRAKPLAVTFADDGEKFGFWPKTYQWVYEEGWLERFFCALERESSWLATATLRDYLTRVGCNGRVYVPCGSYEEMLQWSGGYFRNFFVKYPEANAMYHKMLAASRRIQGLAGRGPTHPTNGSGADAALPTQAAQELYMAQCNCAYWHGVFGGLYLAHLRRAVYQHLLTAERLARSAAGHSPLEELADLDGDGDPELALSTPHLTATLDPGESGALTELSVYDPPINLTDTLTRRYEPYHEKLKAKQPGRPSGESATPASIHDLAGVKEQGLEDALVYDDHRRTSFLAYAFSAMPTPQEILRGALSAGLLWPDGSWTLQPSHRAPRGPDVTVALHRRVGDALLRKTVALAAAKPEVRFRYEADCPIPVVGLEFNLGLFDEQFRQIAWQESVTSVQLRDRALGLLIDITAEPAATLARVPIETVSDSEEGLERTPQGVALMWLWQTAGRTPWACELRWTIRKL
ncbi:MAG: DUF1926 domain-containing protein [Candidatus Omnitrophica bacterium]|nr:DUF1926 domain-containing protein [Candidatus Omnitrophota bacterium]